jgi:molecular chaperone DnaK
MVRDAEANAEADKRRREAVEAKNGLEALIHSTEKTLRENDAKIPADARAEAEQALAGARAAREGEDAEAVRRATETLSQAAMKLGEAMYKATGAEGQTPSDAPGAGGGGSGGQGSGGQGPGGDKVVDADFEEVDPKKKKSA